MNLYRQKLQSIGGYLTPVIVATWSARQRIFVAVTAYAFYLLIFCTLFPWLNTQSMILGAIPILIMAWLFGLWGGVLALIVTFLLNLSLLGLMIGLTSGPPGMWQLFFSPRMLIEGVMVIGFGLATGYLRDLTLQMQAQLTAQQANERALLEQQHVLREQQQFLREQQQSLLVAQQLASIGSWEWDIAANRVTWSDQLYRIYGLQPQEVVVSYESYLARVVPSDRPIVDGTIRRALQDCKPFRFYERILLPDTSVRTLFSHGTVMVDETGKAQRMVGACQDVTDLKQSESELLRREAILYAVALAAGQVLQPGSWASKLELVLASLGLAVDANRISIFENHKDDQGRHLSRLHDQWTRPDYVSKNDPAAWQNFSFAEQGFGRWATILEQGEPIYGVSSDFPPDERALMDALFVEATVVLPIFVGQTWWGFLAIEYSKSAIPWSMAEVEAFKTATRMLGAAIYRQQSTEEMHHQTMRARALEHTASRLNAQLDIESVLRTVCEETVAALHVPVCTISLYDATLQEFRFAWGSGIPADFAQRVQSFPMVQAAPPNRIEVSEGMIVTPDIRALTNLPNAELYAEMDLRTTINVLLQRDGEPIGRLNIGTTGQTRTFNADDLSLLKGLADHAVTAIENARLFQESRRQAQLLRAINRLLNEIVSALDIPHLLETTLDHILSILNLSTGMIWVSGQHTTRGLRADADSYVAHILQEAEEPILQELLTLDDCQQVLAGDSRFPFASAIRQIGLQAAIIIPILGSGRQLGGVIIGQTTARTWDTDEIILMRAVGQQLTTALERLYLRRREQERARQVQQILDIAPEGMLLLDAEQRVMLANPAARHYLSLLTESGLNERLLHLGNESIAAFLQMPDAPLARHEIAIDAPQHYIFEVIARPLLESNDSGEESGSGQGYVLLLRDVTQERQRAEYLQTQERLATVGQLAAGIAHDFNNILTPILLYTDMSLRQVPPDSRLQFNLQQVLTAAARAKDIIYQILAFGRQGTKQGRKPLQLQPIVKETLKLLRAVLPANIEIEQKTDGAIGTVLADATQIHQVLMNLCTNAYHAMSARGGILRVELEVVDVDEEFAKHHPNLKPGQYVRLTVSDTGYGMDRATIARIFDPFFTTKPVGQGTGMGLAMVYGIVMEHKGAIVVESSPGRGSSFHIYLEQIALAAESEELREQQIPGGQERLFVIDDEEAIVEAVKTSLAQIGYTVTTCTDSLEAIYVLRSDSHHFDLVLTDLTMPKMTGVELVKTISQLYPEIPIILTSGYSSDFSQETTALRGVRAYLMKPFEEHTLAVTIRQVLDRRNAN